MTGIGHIFKLQLLILEKHYIFNTGEKTALRNAQKKKSILQLYKSIRKIHFNDIRPGVMLRD